MAAPRDTALIVLKWLVIALTATMLAGMVTLIWLFATRFPQPIAELPNALALPEGETVSAITRGRGFVAVVTDGGEILIFDANGTRLRQRIELSKE
ncbi:hypothetical protein PARPLA_02677 [Rhodobacteraceae bacterium THAF1]|nr:hypothetical protein FIU81_08285 [Palleronia sp. THAF1]VDC28417.1 hypothetical protein PARPLA_02677 [Rhodobacteraceae bacterium THAF1]